MKNIFITGGTGFLTSQILVELARSKNSCRFFLLIRGGVKSSKRYYSLIDEITSEKWIRKYLRENTLIIDGDLTMKNFGFSQSMLYKLHAMIDEIYHGAAVTGFRVPLAIARKVNVSGTLNIFKFALQCKNLKQINYISTMFIAGNIKGEFSEYSMLNQSGSFNNTYEQSKYEAEQLAQSYKFRKFKLLIFRPSIVAGEYQNGRTSNFKMLYEPLHFFSLGLFDTVPAKTKTMQNIIPVDIAANAIIRLAGSGVPGTYHILSPNDLNVGRFMKLAGDYFGYKVPKFIPIENFNFAKLTHVQRQLIDPFVPYLNYKCKFKGEKTRIKLEKLGYACPRLTEKYLRKIFSYCEKVKFIKT